MMEKTTLLFLGIAVLIVVILLIIWVFPKTKAPGEKEEEPVTFDAAAARKALRSLLKAHALTTIGSYILIPCIVAGLLLPEDSVWSAIARIMEKAGIALMALGIVMNIYHLSEVARTCLKIYIDDAEASEDDHLE
jgi:hypothetical protein